MIEVAKGLILSGFTISIVTTIGGLRLFQIEDLDAKYYLVKSSIFEKIERSNLQRLWSYFLATIHSSFMILWLPKHDIVYSPSDYFCDVIPAVLYKLLNPRAKYIAMVHHLCRHPKERLGNKFINYLSFISQRFSFWLIRINADQIYLYDTPEGRFLGCNFFQHCRSKKYYVANGIHLKDIDNAQPSLHTEAYQVCFAGGFRASKGIFDLPFIWSGVLKKMPAASLVIAGAGTEAINFNLIQEFRKHNSLINVSFVGALDSMQMYEVLKSSKVFISTSYEEGWGISVFEALGAGLEVLAYQLPAFQFLKDQIKLIPIGDRSKYLEELLKMLEGKTQKNSKSNRQFIEEYDWGAISRKEAALIKEAIN